MRIAFTHNLRLTDAEEEAEFDTAETVDAHRRGARAAGHEVEKIEVSGPASAPGARSRRSRPTSSSTPPRGGAAAPRGVLPGAVRGAGHPVHRLGRLRAHGHARQVAHQAGARASTASTRPRGWYVERSAGARQIERRSRSPVIVKPNYEGSSKGIGDDSVVARPARAARAWSTSWLDALPGRRARRGVHPRRSTSRVPFIEGPRRRGRAAAGRVRHRPGARRRAPLQHLRLPAEEHDSSEGRGALPGRAARATCCAAPAISAATVVARARHARRRPHRLPRSARTGASTSSRSTRCRRWSRARRCSPPRREGLDYDAVHRRGRRERRACAAACSRPARAGAADRSRTELRVGFTFNMKRVDPSAGNDAEAEYDPPETIDAIRDGHRALRPRGGAARGQRPSCRSALADAKVDLVFNIAEGLRGATARRRCRRCASCSASRTPARTRRRSALALDKALAKRILRQHGILTPEFQVMTTGREKLLPMASSKFPLIVKPNAEGSSKGITATSVVSTTRPALRAAVHGARRRVPPAGARRGVHPRARVHGRACSATSGRACCRRWRSCFKDKSKTRPVYDFEIKQEWEKHVYYECPAKLTPRGARGGRAGGARDLHRARLPRRRARRPAHDAEGAGLRARGQPAAGADARLLGPRADREGGGHRVPHADRRDPGRRAQAAAREAARGECAKARRATQRERDAAASRRSTRRR